MQVGRHVPPKMVRKHADQQELRLRGSTNSATSAGDSENTFRKKLEYTTDDVLSGLEPLPNHPRDCMVSLRSLQVDLAPRCIFELP
jgi:hypothetical protein